MDFASKYISEVGAGKGLIGGAKEAARGSTKDFGKRFGKDSLAKTMFGGEDILSALIRSKLGIKTKKDKETRVSPESLDQGLSSEGVTFIKIVAKNSMSLPGMARDMNVMRQNVQKLVKLRAGPQKKGTKAYATGADAFFLREDERERALEAQRGRKGVGKVQSLGPSKDKEGGILDSIISFFSGGFTNAFKSIFNPKTLMKVFTKVFLPIAIIGSMFSGIMDGFKKYKETGNFSDAIVSGLGGMLNFVTLGLFGEDTLKKLFDSISNFFQPITDTISNIFNGIKNFVKGLFGGKVDVKDEAPAKADSVKPTMPDPAKFASGAAKASGASDEKSADLGAIFGAVGKGDVGSLFAKAQEFAAKYPEPPPTETTPEPVTKEGIPLEQAQRNYELNKVLTGEASKALGRPLEMPKPPEPATPATPPAPVKTAPTPAPEMSDADKIKELEGYIENNKKAFAKRQEAADRHVASLRRRYPDQPDKVKEIEDDYKEYMEKSERPAMEKANAEFQSQIDAIKKSKKGSITPGSSSASSPTASSGSTSESSSAVSSGAGGGGATGSVSGGSSAPSGAEMSQTSSQVAEGQRMESAADQGSVINSPVNNNQVGSSGGSKPKSADAYNVELFNTLVRT